MENKERKKLKRKLFLIVGIILIIVAIILGINMLNKKENSKIKKTYIEVEESFFDDISKREYEIIGENIFFEKNKKLDNPIYDEKILPNLNLISNYLKTEYPEIKIFVTVSSINEYSDGISIFFNPVIGDTIIAEDTLAALSTVNGEVQESVVDNLDDFINICKKEVPEFIDVEMVKTKAIDIFKENRTNIETNFDNTIKKEYYLGFIDGVYYYSFDVGNSYIIINAENGEVLETSFDS